MVGQCTFSEQMVAKKLPQNKPLVWIHTVIRINVFNLFDCVIFTISHEKHHISLVIFME